MEVANTSPGFPEVAPSAESMVQGEPGNSAMAHGDSHARGSSKNSDEGSTLVISSWSLPGAGDIEQVSLGVVDFLQVAIVSSRLDSCLRRDSFIVTRHYLEWLHSGLQKARYHHTVCSARGGDRQSHRKVQEGASAPAVQRFPSSCRRQHTGRPKPARDRRQLRHPSRSKVEALVG